jgi:hypothetical protein
MPATRQGRRHRRTAWAFVVGCLWLTTVVGAYTQDSPQCGGAASAAPAVERARAEPRLVVAVEGLPRRGEVV